VMLGTAWMIIDRLALPVAPLLSVTWTVKLDVPDVVGVPLDRLTSFYGFCDLGFIGFAVLIKDRVGVSL